METIISFLGTHWIWFVVIVIFLIFALIGYIVDSNSIDLDKPETMKANENEPVEVLTPTMDKVEEDKPLVESVPQKPVKEQVVTEKMEKTNIQPSEVVKPKDDEPILKKNTRMVKKVEDNKEEVAANELKKLIEEKYETDSTFKK